MSKLPGTVLIAPIVPSDSLDTYPTHRDIYGQGGHRSVADQTARDAITTERRKEGMIVYVAADETNYQLVGGTTNSDWQVMTTGSSGGSGFTPYEGEGITITASGADYIFSVDDYISKTQVASISGDLQAQIDSIEVSGGSGFTPLEGTAMDISPSGSDWVFNVDLDKLDERYQLIGGGVSGTLDLLPAQRVYTVAHSLTGDYVINLALIGVSSDNSISAVMASNKLDNSFDVILGGVPGITGMKVDWTVREVVTSDKGSIPIPVDTRIVSISHPLELPYFVNVSLYHPDDETVFPLMITDKANNSFDVIAAGSPSISGYQIEYAVYK